MSTENMFETATRRKLRFPCKGNISVEDLWDLSVNALDVVYKTLNSLVKETNEESLLSMKSKLDETLELQIEIVKYIVSVKLQERKAREEIRDKKEMKQKILEIKAERETNTLKNASDEELDKLLSDLE